MIRNGVIDAVKEFSERGYLTKVNRTFDKVKEDIKKYKIDVEMCRETYIKSAESLLGCNLFAVIEDDLVIVKDTKSKVENWNNYKQKNNLKEYNYDTSQFFNNL